MLSSDIMQGRVNAAKLQRIEALHNKQQAVLKRKTEEAEAARKRLKVRQLIYLILPTTHGFCAVSL